MYRFADCIELQRLKEVQDRERFRYFMVERPKPRIEPRPSRLAEGECFVKPKLDDVVDIKYTLILRRSLALQIWTSGEQANNIFRQM